MNFGGSLGDGSTTETSTTSGPEFATLFLWNTFRPAGEAILDKIIDCRSVATALRTLQGVSGFGGSGFVAATTLHTLVDCDKKVDLFGFRNDEHQHTAVGPTTRKLINLVEERPLRLHQYGGDDEFYLEKLRKITANVAAVLPPGSNGVLRRTLATLRVVQFNLCKLHSVWQYQLTGKVGNNGRAKKARPLLDLSESGEESEEDDTVLAQVRCEKLKRVR